MAQGFAQGFASGFGLVSDIFKEKRQAEAQEKQMAFQREQFEESKRRSDVAEARASAAEARAGSAEARAREAAERESLEFSRRTDMEDVTKALRLGDAEYILSHKKLGPELLAQTDPKYRELYERLNAGQLSLDQIDVPTANTLLAPELRRGVGEKTSVRLNPADKNSPTKNITVVNKSIESISPVEGNPNLLSLNMLVEGVDDKGQRILFTDKMTTGRTVGGDEKNIPVRQAVDYLTIGKRSVYNLFSNTPAFRNIATAYGVGLTPEQEQRVADNARNNYSRILDANQKRLESLAESNAEAFEKTYKGMTPYEAAEAVTKRYFGGMDVEQHISSTIQRIKTGSDSSQISRLPDLDQTVSDYSSIGLNIRNKDEAIRMKNDEFAIASKYGDDAIPIIRSMVQTFASRKGEPITFEEYRQLTREIANMKTPLTPENFQGVIGQAVNRLVRGEGAEPASETSSVRSKVGGVIQSTGSAISSADPLGIVGLRDVGETVSSFGRDVSGEAEKKTKPAVNADVAKIAPNKYASQISAAAANAKIDPVVLARIAKTESNFRDDIVSGKTVSSANAVGIVQMVPKWHPDVDFDRVKTDTQYALNEGAAYFKELLDRFGGDYEKAAAAYNWGPTNLAKLLDDRNKAANWKKHLPNETKNYLKSVLG